jgi:Protein of unknown function (DUF3455)
MLKLIAISAVALLALAAQQVPSQLQPPVDQKLLFQLHGKGDQIYSCKADGTWTLKAPEAQLFDKDDKPFGKHFAGPSWQANDGSKVVGKALANAPSPDPQSIPWLLVDVVSHDGNGSLTPVTVIQRLNTKGGKAPSAGCDAAHVDQESRVPYTADYLFYGPR